MWKKVADDNYAAASTLVQSSDPKYCRSAVNRAYYAVYARAAGALMKRGVAMPVDREGPTHAKLPSLIENHLIAMKGSRWTVSEYVRRLYKFRLVADYRPSDDMGDTEARNALTLMGNVFHLMKGF